MKTCTRCKETKSLDMFYNSKAVKCGKTARCKKCMYECKLDWQKRNPNRVKKSHKHRVRKWRHGVDKEEYIAMKENQNNLCAICQNEKELCIDHCHTRNEIRGMLCRQCNSALGLFYDNEEFLYRAINYLRYGPTLAFLISPMSPTRIKKSLNTAQSEADMDVVQCATGKCEL